MSWKIAIDFACIGALWACYNIYNNDLKYEHKLHICNYVPVWPTCITSLNKMGIKTPCICVCFSVWKLSATSHLLWPCSILLPTSSSTHSNLTTQTHTRSNHILATSEISSLLSHPSEEATKAKALSWNSAQLYECTECVLCCMKAQTSISNFNS